MTQIMENVGNPLERVLKNVVLRGLWGKLLSEVASGSLLLKMLFLSSQI